ncbi:hypothetical protein D1007_51751 [Hordeum vulgare]|uniref:FLZ-type domain-containing protein n=1 Tax=Hordeum vulgare subsp. vulgare TaxID=112509 RepID=A0A8I6YUZ3_HORVV|nr:FCS-Like Zinc finger 7-like [Hordeum vulgare subsp. vulgare]KAE8775745.1 hypothetical protein D1007_51751 [Hordeum vulgare]KAI4981784.1 hypothetical protein ZWY2020_022276 [Hordeum vulgare]
MLRKRQRSMLMRRTTSLASTPRQVRQVGGDGKQARARPIFYVSADTVEMGAAYVRRDAFSGLLVAAAFLTACGICSKSLRGIDIYIYRGEFSFCSDECREQYIEMEKKYIRTSSRKAPSDQSGSSCGRGSCGGPG